MKLRNNSALRAGVTLVLGLAALGLRLALYRVGVDEKGLLTPGHPLEIGVWIVTAAAAALAVLPGKEPPENRNLRLEALGELLAAAGILLALPEGIRSLSNILEALQLTLAMAACAGLGYGAVRRLRGRSPSAVYYGLPCLFFALNVVCCYRGWVSHPQLQDYLFPLLGARSMMVFAYLRCVPEKHRIRRAVGLMGGFLCLAAASKVVFWPMYLGCGLWMLTNADAPGEPL